jgi:uncharacterized protein (PEP-CTERM system associated)
MAFSGFGYRFDRLARAACLVLVGTLCSAPVVLAGDWKVTDSVKTGVTWLDRSGNDPSSGLVLQLSPKVSLAGRGARAKANVSYGLNATVGNSDTETRGLSHDLSATGQLEAIEDLVLIDAQASAKLVGNSATSGTVDSLNAEQDGRQSYSFKVSPSLKHQFDNRYVTVVSNNSFDLVGYTGGTEQANDSSTSNSWNLGLQSGPLFTTFNWDLGVTETTTSYEDRDDTRTSYSAGLGYRIDAQWRLNLRGGWEENDVQTDRDDTDGATWNVGGVWTPNPRTTVSGDYGYRYIGNTFALRASHRSRRTNVSLDASRDISNRRAARLADSFFFLADQTGVPIIDPNTGNPIIVNLPQLQETDEDYVNTQLRAAVSVVGRRTSVTLTGDIANRKYEVSNADEDSYGLSVRVSRQLGGALSASLSGSLDHAEGTVNGSSDTYDIGFQLSRKLGRRTSAAIDLLHRERDATNDNDSYTENRIGFSITSSFL